MNKDLAEGAPPHLNVRHLEIFWAMMRSGNQHETARILGLSQPAVSKLLRYTEQRLGFPLFQRIKGRLQPTSEARVLFHSVDEIFGRLDAAGRLARDLRRRLTGRITITTSSAFNQVLLPDALAEFLRSHRQVQIGLKILTPADAVERVANGQADLGVTFGPLDVSGVEVHTLRMVPMVCVVPPGHPLAAAASVALHNLVSERLITATERPAWGRLLEEGFAAIGERPDIVVECTQPDAGFALAGAGVGIAVMPALPMRPGERGETRPLRPPILVPLMAVTAQDKPMRHAVAVLIEQLRCTVLRLQWGTQ